MKIFSVLRHITRMVTASGKMRIFYVFANVFLVLISIAAGCGIYFFVNHIGDSLGYFILGIIGIILCIGVAITSFLQGVIGEIVLTVMAFVGIFISKEKLNNFISFTLTILVYIVVITLMSILI